MNWFQIAAVGGLGYLFGRLSSDEDTGAVEERITEEAIDALQEVQNDDRTIESVLEEFERDKQNLKESGPTLGLRMSEIYDLLSEYDHIIMLLNEISTAKRPVAAVIKELKDGMED